MIRPITCLACLLACGSGLYLYQSKHRVKMLDEQIAQVVKSTDALHEQARMLSAEWTLLNDPERLRQLANQFLTLQTVSPGQFTSLADLDSRLPPPVPPGAPIDPGAATPALSAPVPVAADGVGHGGTDEGKATNAKVAEAPISGAPRDAASKDAASKDAASKDGSAKDGSAKDGSAKDAASRDASRNVAEKDSAPPSAVPAPPRVAIAAPPEAPRFVEHKPSVQHAAPAQPRFVASQPRMPDHRAFEPREPDPRLAEIRGVEPRVAEVRPFVPAGRPPVVVPAPMPPSGGSMLGMAHGMAAPPAPMPLPRPVPVSAPQWSYSNGG